MLQVPNTLEDAIANAKQSTQRAIEAGCGRVQVELIIPEIALQAQALALEFTTILEQYGSGLKVLFPDTGAAALAKRDWGETWFSISDLGGRAIPIEGKITTEDTAFLVVCPSAIEVKAVENLCNLAENRPVILIIPQLEDVTFVGIGVTARELRERFLSTLESAYYFRPLAGAAVLRSYPSRWEVHLETENGYELIAEEFQKPMGEDLELLLAKATQGSEDTGEVVKPKPTGFLSNMQRFLRALTQ